MFQQLSTEAGSRQGSSQVIVGIVCLCTLVEEGSIAFFVRVVAFVEFLSGREKSEISFDIVFQLFFIIIFKNLNTEKK